LISLPERRILVTGGLGAIGSTAVAAFIAAGAEVVVNDLHSGDSPLDSGAEYVRGDGSTDEGARAIIRGASQNGMLTDAVLLAGVVHSAPLLEQHGDAIESLFRTNYLAATLTAKAAVAAWLERGVGGNIVFVSSWVQDVPWPGIAPYAASKAALRSTARSFAREFGTQGIRANVLAPGIVAAGMAQRQWEDEPDYRRRARRAIPLGYLQPAESAANALLFLCSPLSSYMTGATLLVDGGASLYPLDPEEVPPDPA
jgi:NAD(P)-dependent dehydrogenase (short-subunit alcohol dehydrogenase family)